MIQNNHIPHLTTITDFYQTLKIGQPQSNDFSLIRLEDYPDTRSAEMPLFRCNFYRIVFFENSEISFQLPNEQLHSSANSVYFSYPGKMESWFTTQKNYGYLLCFTADFARINPLQSDFYIKYPYFDFRQASLIQITSKEAMSLQHTLKVLHDEATHNFSERENMLRHLLHTYLIRVKRIYTQHQEALSGTVKNSHNIYHRFIKEVEAYFVELANERIDQQPNVSEIAARMHLNPSYLNTVIKSVTGRTALMHIQGKIILEAKSYLLHTNLQIAQISYKLGFAYISYFIRFFKRKTGTTPAMFRSTHNGL